MGYAKWHDSGLNCGYPTNGFLFSPCRSSVQKIKIIGYIQVMILLVLKQRRNNTLKNERLVYLDGLKTYCAWFLPILSKWRKDEIQLGQWIWI